MDKISLKAPAKLNLYLRVLGKRGDGYHEIESLMQAINLYDEITIEKSDLLEMECDDPSLPVDENNLALKAAMLLQQHAYFPGARIILKKRIPAGSGLGGGSSDAAFVLRGIRILYNMEISTDKMLELAAKIGSDVPFFLSAGQALVSGMGEKIRPVRMPLDYKLLIIVPPAASSTARAYGKLKNGLTKKSDPFLLEREISSSSFYRLMGTFVNDLEEAVFGDLPELAAIKNMLINSGCIYSSMTGSGSAVFGVYQSTKTGEIRLDSKITEDCTVFNCSPILLPPF